MLKYKVFPSSEAFEKFQTNKDINIVQIQPFVSNIKFDANANGTELEGLTNVAVFIVYKEYIKSIVNEGPSM